MNKPEVTKQLSAFKNFVFLLIALFAFASCGETDEDVEEFANWQEKNATEWNRIYSEATQRIAAGDTSWKILKAFNLPDTVHGANTDYIVVHEMEKGEDDDAASPLFTDKVRVHYKGHLLSSASYSEGYQFDSSWKTSTTAETAVPSLMTVSTLTEGFATALLHMHVGDNWTVYVPWTLAYGASGTTGIPAYSVLVFDMQLVSFYRDGADVPAFKAKRGLMTE